MMRIYLSKNPTTGEVFAQNRALTRGDFPPGPRGNGWPQRYLDLESGEFEQILEGGLPQEDLDLLQQGWWDAAIQVDLLDAAGQWTPLGSRNV